MKKSFIKKTGLTAMAALLPLTASAADVSISGWINEELTYFDAGTRSDIVQSSGNGVTLGSRLTFSASQELPAGLTAGMEVILEPAGVSLTSLNSAPLTAGNNFDQGSPLVGEGVTTLGHNVSIAGNFGKLTFGLQTTPTDNIGVLADPTVGLWDAIAIPYHLIGVGLGNSGFSVGSFLNCNNLGAGGAIGADCNGIYRTGIRYDLPAFNNVRIALGHSNDDIYDVSAEWNGDLGGLNAALGLGYMVNNGPQNTLITGSTGAESVDLFQLQAGLHDASNTGLYGWVYYQNEDSDLNQGVTGQTDSDTYMFKGGIKRAFNSLGDTSISGFYGSYNDMFGNTGGVGAASTTNAGGANAGTVFTGSEVERIGFSVVQYFGSAFQIYGMYENLEVEAEGTGAGVAAANAAPDLDVFTLGTVFFF